VATTGPAPDAGTRGIIAITTTVVEATGYRLRKIVILVEGVAFAVGVLMLAVSTYLMAIEAIRNAKRSP
jgi:hypothetical protein